MLLETLANYNPFPFPVTEQLKPWCLSITLLFLFFVIFIYPLMFYLGRKARNNNKIRDYFTMAMGLFLISTEIANEIILLYKHGFHPIDMKYGSNNNDSEMYYISFESDEFKVLEKCWKSAKLITLMKNSANTDIQHLATIIGSKTIYDTLNFRSSILSKIKDDMYYLFENDSVFSFRNNSDIILNKPYTIQDLKKAIEILYDIVKIYQSEIMS